jgi:hypothetical protein
MAMRIAVTKQVRLRNSTGRFRADCSRAAGRTIRKAIDDGAELSRGFAPRGHKHDTRTIPLADSIEATQTGRTSGHWEATARHALPQELGAAPHSIPGDVTFFWEEKGRFWEPGENEINHPGNAPQPYLKPAFDIIMARIMAIAKRYYPG